MSSSNLLKGNYIKENGKRIIDYNDLISSKIESLRKQAEEGNVNTGFVSGISAQAVESLIGPQDEAEGQSGIEKLLTGVSGKDESMSGEIPELTELAQGVLADAHEKADALLSKAQADADALLADARRQGQEDGYREGYEKGYSEGKHNAESEYSSRFQALDEEKRQLLEDYDAKYAKIEPEIVNTVLDVIGQVTGIIYEGNKDILVHLINRVLNEVEPSSEYTIKVSPEDYEFVIGRQGRLYSASARDMNIEVVEDTSLAAGKCLIETDGGIFDCSLDVQMEQLVQDIRLLAGV